MEKKKSGRRKSTSTSACELIHIQGFAFCKNQLYQFSPQSGEFVYVVGCNIVVYDTVDKFQKEYLSNPKGLPYASIVFSEDGQDLFAGEYMAKEANIKQYSLSKSGRFVAKSTNNIKTKFRAIDALAISSSKSMLAIYGTMRNEDKKDLKKLEIYSLTTKASVAVSALPYKVKEMFFSADDTLYIL